MKGERFFPLVVVAAGLLAYHNSFTGTFMDDDFRSILQNPSIRHLWPIWQPLSPPHRDWLTVEGRPLINLSLAISYALSGHNVWGYHVLNLTVHVLAGLVLLGIVRRTLLQPALRERFGAAADELALATAVLWTVHPLQTESVTYMIQRAESIMGLFYLLTLYSFIRGVEPPPVGNGKWFMGNGSWELRSRLWYGLSVTACALGMASKEAMVSAPLMVLLYDRAFLSASFPEAWRRRWPMYLALASTWIVLGFVLVSAGIFAHESARARQFAWTWWEYLATEPGVILYYLRLCLWPSPLCMNHPWPIAKTWGSILPPAVAVAILLAASVWAWGRKPAWGFVGAWFFLILAPTSSVLPLPDLIYEHRMYLSLAAAISAVVVGLYSLVGRRSLAVFAVAAVALGFLTWRRNQDYRSEVVIRVDAATKFPDSPLAHYKLAVALQRAGSIQGAIAQYERALAIDPDDAEGHYNLGVILQGQGKLPEAIGQYEQALRLKPAYAEAHNSLGATLGQLNRAPEAIKHLEQALRLNPGYAEAHYNLGNALLQMGKVDEAIGHYNEALRLKPDYAEAHNNLGGALVKQGRLTEAVAQFQEALRLEPDYAEAHNSLGATWGELGRVPEAIQQFERALRIAPDMAVAHCNLGVALERVGRVQEARRHYEQAVRLKPDYAGAREALARLRNVDQVDRP